MLFQSLQQQQHQQQQSYFCQDETEKTDVPVYLKEEDEEEDEAAVAAGDEGEFNYCDDLFNDYIGNDNGVQNYSTFIDPQQTQLSEENYTMYPQQNTMMFAIAGTATAGGAGTTTSSTTAITTTASLPPTAISSPRMASPLNLATGQMCPQQQSQHTTTMMPSLVAPLPAINHHPQSLQSSPQSLQSQPLQAQIPQMNPLLSYQGCQSSQDQMQQQQQQQQQQTFPSIIAQVPTQTQPETTATATTQIPILNNANYMCQMSSTSMESSPSSSSSSSSMSGKPQRKRKRKSPQQQSAQSTLMGMDQGQYIIPSQQQQQQQSSSMMAMGPGMGGMIPSTAIMGLSGSGSSSGNSSGEERSIQEHRMLQNCNSEIMTSVIAKLDAGELLGKDEILLLNGEQVEIYFNEAKARIQLTEEQKNFIKKYRRLIKNKEYAQQSRDKKKKYIFDLEAKLDFAKVSITKLKQDISNLSIKNKQLEDENRSLHKELSMCRDRLMAIHSNTVPQSSSSLSPPDSASNSPENAHASYASMASTAYTSAQRPGYFVPMFAVCLMGLCLGLLFGPLASVVPGLGGLMGLGNSTVDVFDNIRGTGRTLKSEVNQQQSSFSGWVRSLFYGSYQGNSGLNVGTYGNDDGNIADVINSVVGNNNNNDDNEKRVPYEDLLIKKDLIGGDKDRDKDKDKDKVNEVEENKRLESLDLKQNLELNENEKTEIEKGNEKNAIDDDDEKKENELDPNTINDNNEVNNNNNN